MNIKQLQFISAVATTRSFVKAAELCHVTQPTLSNAIAQLELELENKLFIRTTRSVSLSPFGKQILPTIKRAISDIEEIVTSAKSWRNPTHKLIRLGLSPVVDMNYLQTILAPFYEANPDVKFYYKECYMNDLDERLKRGELDLVIMPPRKLKSNQPYIDLYSEPLCYVPCGDTQEASESVLLSDIANENLVLTIDACGLRGVTLDLFKENNASIKEYPGQATSYTVVEQWAGIGIGAGILPQSKLSANNSSASPLILDSGDTAKIHNVVIWDPNVVGVTHVQALLDHLQIAATETLAVQKG